jgi:hypothetical protein
MWNAIELKEGMMDTLTILKPDLGYLSRGHLVACQQIDEEV